MSTDGRGYEDYYDAVHSAIVNGKGYKATSLHLWPRMKPDSAYAKLKACLNDEKPEKLDFEDVICICIYNDRFDPMYFFCDATSHKRPERKTKAEEVTQLMREFNSAAAQLGKIQKAIEDMQGLRLAVNNED